MDILKTIRKEIQKSDKSRYRISKETGIRENQLHRILKNRQDLYCKTAVKLLDYFGYEIKKRK